MQNAFLYRLAEQLYNKYQNRISDICLVFQNKRSGLFFNQYLAKIAQKTMSAPQVVSIEVLMEQVSDYPIADKLYLIFELYEIYNQALENEVESFDKFYFWGDMLLRDFSELDLAMADARKVFAQITAEEEINLLFDALADDEELRAALRSFWGAALDSRNQEAREKFLAMWQALPDIYATFRERLQHLHCGYEGLVFRNVAEKSKEELQARLTAPMYIFAGFGSFSKAEERFLEKLLQLQKAAIIWDVDAFYLENPHHEAGSILRKYRKNPIFADTFPQEIPNQIRTIPKNITATQVALEVGQTKAAGQLLATLSKEELDNTIVLLSSEHLLFPMLHAIPENVRKINVTMGYPLRNTPLFSLMQLFIELQLSHKLSKNGNVAFYFRQVLALLRHPYIVELDEKALELAAEIEKQGKLYISPKRFHEQNEIYQRIFRLIEHTDDIFEWLYAILTEIYKKAEPQEENQHNVEQDYIFSLFNQLQRLQDIISTKNIEIEDVKTTWKILEQIIENIKLPFTGEPLEGLQVMGILESRNLDFERVLVLGANEGTLPPKSPKGSFIPYHVRKAFQLTTPEQHDALFAYYFYKMIHTTKHVHFFYNTESYNNIKAEKSRFLLQLQMDLQNNFSIETNSPHRLLKGTTDRLIVIPKTPKIIEKIKQRFGGQVEEKSRKKALSPTALTTLITCSLQFYFKYIAQIQPLQEVKEDITPDVLGNLLHNSIERLYKDLNMEKKNKKVDKDDFVWLHQQLEKVLEKELRKEMKLDEDEVIEWEGKNVIIKEVVLNQLRQILYTDEKLYAPFEFVALEGSNYALDFDINGHNLCISGKIDRIDKVGGTTRIIDYKTGKDERKFATIEEIFDENNEKGIPKAVFQTLLYALLYRKSEKNEATAALNAGLYLLREMTTEKEKYDYRLKLVGKDRKTEPINQIDEYLVPFEMHLKELLEKLLNKDIPFAATEHEEKCKYCDYKSICHRD